MSSFTEEFEYEDTGRTRNGRRIYRLTKSFTYYVGSLSQPLAAIEVPLGFETDFASIPAWLHWVIPADGLWAKASAMHDFLYDRHAEVSKIIADSIFLEAMLVAKVNPFIAHSFFIIVRIVQSLKEKGFDIGY